MFLNVGKIADKAATGPTVSDSSVLAFAATLLPITQPPYILYSISTLTRYPSAVVFSIDLALFFTLTEPSAFASNLRETRSRDRRGSCLIRTCFVWLLPELQCQP